MTHKYRCAHRESRLLAQFLPGAMPGGPEFLPYAPAGLPIHTYNAMPYAAQITHMQQPQWMHEAVSWQMHMHMQAMPTMPWYPMPLGGMHFDAFAHGHYLPYAHLHHGAGWHLHHPAWGSNQTPTPRPNVGMPPTPPPSRPPAVMPPTPRPPTPGPHIPRSHDSRLPSHPLDVGGRLANAYGEFLYSDDPVVRAAALRWWNKAIVILERHPHDSTIFNQLVRGATDNFRRATTQHLGMRDARRAWESRQPRPQIMQIAVHAAERDAGAITISRSGSSERILYYPHKSAPFWDMRSMDLAREWGVVLESATYATGEYPRTVEVRFYGPGEYSLGGVGGVQVPQGRVSVPPLAA